MTISDDPIAIRQHALSLACRAFTDSTLHYHATPVERAAVKGHARERLSAQDEAPDAWIRFAVAGKRFDMPVVVQPSAGTLGAGAVVNRMLSQPASLGSRPLMLVTQHVTPKLANELVARHIPFLDTAGNAYLQEPEATIMIVGRANPSLSRTDQTSRSTTPKGLRVSFALLTQPDLVQAPYRSIADRSAVALNTVNLAIDDLMTRGLVVPKGARRVIADRRRLIEDWVSLFPSRLRPKLGSRRFTSWANEKKWWNEAAGLEPDALLGGETGADVLTHEIKPASLTIYSHGGVTPQLMAQGMLRPDERGDVEILEAFWPRHAERGWNLSQGGVVHPLLVYADLITSSDDRNRAVARTIYDQYLAKEPA